jgi:hypothetical protein
VIGPPQGALREVTEGLGLRYLRDCEVLVYDRLVAEELLDEAPAGALRIARDDFKQEDVNKLLVMHGRNGRRVVRLKGGDPFVFGRGGEEALVDAACCSAWRLLDCGGAGVGRDLSRTGSRHGDGIAATIEKPTRCAARVPGRHRVHGRPSSAILRAPIEHGLTR